MSWTDVASERWDKLRETRAGSIDTVRRFGGETRGQARSVRNKLPDTIAERTRPRREGEEERAE
jgi:hypothetical protein